MIHLFSADNPRRPVNWRYERARSIVEGGVPLSRKYDDGWVHRAMRFRQAFEACDTEVDHAVCAQKYRDIYWAHDIRYTSDLEVGNPFKSEIEARLLAADSHQNIAQRLATSAAVVQAYERLFFNVEERRQNQGYIIHQVLGPAVYLGVQEQEYDTLWKLVAIMGGPVALDMMIDGFVGTSRPTNPADIVSWLTESTQNAIRRKALVAALTIRVNNYNATELIVGFLKLLEIEKAAGRGGSGAETLLNNVDMMLKALPIQVGGRVTHVDVPQLDQYDNLNAELRCEEMVAIGIDRDIPARRLLEQYAYPPPPGRAADFFPHPEGR
jgi:hypothetical protein